MKDKNYGRTENFTQIAELAEQLKKKKLERKVFIMFQERSYNIMQRKNKVCEDFCTDRRTVCCNMVSAIWILKFTTTTTSSLSLDGTEMVVVVVAVGGGGGDDDGSDDAQYRIYIKIILSLKHRTVLRVYTYVWVEFGTGTVCCSVNNIIMYNVCAVFGSLSGVAVTMAPVVLSIKFPELLKYWLSRTGCPS